MSSQTMTLREWLLTDTPTSRRQARLAAYYKGWLTLRSNHMAMGGLAIIVLLVAVAIFAPLLAPHDPYYQDLGNRLQPLGTEGHILGTDSLGRDILSRLIWGARITLYIVALVAMIAPIVGLLVGTVSGYVGRLGRHHADAGDGYFPCVPAPCAGAGLCGSAGSRD